MLVVLSVLLPIMLVHNYYFSYALPKLASSFLESLHEGESSRAYYSFTTDNFKAKTSLVQFKEFIKKHPVLANLSSFQVERVEPLNGVLDVWLADQIVAFRFQRSNFSWKLAKVGVGGDYLPVEDGDNELTRAIERQLSLINNGEIADAYYTCMSREFQNRTSLGSFQEMVEFFTPLKNKLESVKSIEAGNYRVCLEGAEGEYSLCKENGLWKINGFDFSDREDRDPKELIQSQLEAIRSRELAKAYFAFTSKEFQKSFSLQDFKTFVKKQELFFHHRAVQLHSAKQEATWVATLCSVEDEQFPVEYQLVLEKGIWKINHILIN